MKRKLADFFPLSPAEMQLKDEVHLGHVVRVSKGLPEEDAAEEVRVRASFVRYLALGGCDACRPSEKGVRVRGAFIWGDNIDPRAQTAGLDLQGCTLAGDLLLAYCRFPDVILLRSASLQNLNLQGSFLTEGLAGDRMRARGGVFLRGLHARGVIRFPGAKLGDDLACEGAILQAGWDGVTLYADRLRTEGGVFLRRLESDRTIRLRGAKLGGDLDCTGAMLMAGGMDGSALDADNLQIGGVLLLRRRARTQGVFNLANARADAVADHTDCWPARGSLILNGFRYDAFLGADTPVTAEERLDWLALQYSDDSSQEFWPQPYEQLARVFRSMGHPSDARKVLIAKERLQRAALRKRASRWLRPLLWSKDAALGVTVCYGREPLWAFAWLLGLFLIGTGVFWTAERAGALKPNNAFVLRSPEWTFCATPTDEKVQLAGADQGAPGRLAEAHAGSQYRCFLAQPEAQSYPQFSPVVYSLDTLLPVVELEMQQFWIPDESSGWVGRGARIYLWIQIGAGWALSLLAVAGFSGLIKIESGE